MEKRFILLGIVFFFCLVALLGCQGERGAFGPQGETGDPGPSGHSLQINTIVANPPTVFPGDTAEITAIITYLGDDSLRYTWTPQLENDTLIKISVIPELKIYNVTGDWVAPRKLGSYVVSLTIFEKEGYFKASGEVALLVSSGLYPAPVTLNTNTITDSTVGLSWSKNTDPPSLFFSYDVYHSATQGELPGSTPDTTIHDQDHTTYTVRGLSELTTYYFKVYVTNIFSLSTGSDEVGVSTWGTKVDTLLYDESDYDDTLYCFPNPSGHDSFNVRFTPMHPCTLKEVKLYFCTDSDWITPNIRVYIWDDDGGFPGVEKAWENVDGGDINFDDWTSVNVLERKIYFDAYSAFHVGFTLSESGTDTIGILSDDGRPVGAEQRSSAWNTQEAKWETLYESSGSNRDYNLLIRTVVKYIRGEVELWPGGRFSRDIYGGRRTPTWNAPQQVKILRR